MINHVIFLARDIRPKDHNDFDPKKLCYVYWCYCEGSECAGTSKLCKYNKAYIFGLGGNFY